MKKKVIVITVILFVIWRFCIVNIGSVNKCEIVFDYFEHNVEDTLTKEEIYVICDMFEGNLLYSDSPSCGFSEDVSIKINGYQTFCIANDGCPLIYYKEMGRYFMISDEEMSMLHDILESHGFIFPCI